MEKCKFEEDGVCYSFLCYNEKKECGCRTGEGMRNRATDRAIRMRSERYYAEKMKRIGKPGDKDYGAEGD